ncbi:Uncharacterised protein [Vibrio cholerae]|nr:Uncharacterised protein [Vibrio cholerae]CSC21387.1 Uncharacterised protein [Vibrio cholerae]CSC29612.1 Uncharacterised protein [Vibrio cholerae]CSC58692.1 Uncharacterised protein [Vibrio cholerae]CSC85918.1 Uncharacterised protein [Vibrio cholerae]
MKAFSILDRIKANFGIGRNFYVFIDNAMNELTPFAHFNIIKQNTVDDQRRIIDANIGRDDRMLHRAARVDDAVSND